MKSQGQGGLYKSGESKQKERPTKADKVYDAMQAEKRRALARVSKKETATS